MRSPVFALLPIAAAALLGCAGPTLGQRQVDYPEGGPQWAYETRDGVPHGSSTTYHPDGQVRSRGSYRDGRKDGRFEHFRADGSFDRQLYYYRGLVVWSSDDQRATPPTELLVSLGRLEREAEPASDLASAMDGRSPLPRFGSLDRPNGDGRAGLVLGVGGPSDDRALVRTTVFAHHAVGAYGGYLQLDGSRLLASDSLEGRRTLELGATHHRDLAGGRLAPRLGLVVPIGHDDQTGFMVSAAGAYQRPTDAVASLPATVALRSGASWWRAGHRWVVQGDGGVDWAMGGAQALRPLLRLNGGLGYGSRSLLATVELSNSVRIDDPGQRLHAIGVGSVLSIGGVWLSALVSQASGGHTTVCLGAGRGF
jgi:hypothetical protein